MKREVLIRLSGYGLRVGFISGCLLGIYELIKYISNELYLHSGVISLIYVLVLLLIIPTVTWLHVKNKIFTFWEHFYIQFIGYIVCSLIVSLVTIFIHYGIDIHYKETIANYKVEAIHESNLKLEQRINAKIISSDVDFNKIRQEALASYQLNKLLLYPIGMIPPAVIFSLIFSFIFSIIHKFR